jgi:hypothetical protein
MNYTPCRSSIDLCLAFAVFWLAIIICLFQYLLCMQILDLTLQWKTPLFQTVRHYLSECHCIEPNATLELYLKQKFCIARSGLISAILRENWNSASKTSLYHLYCGVKVYNTEHWNGFVLEWYTIHWLNIVVWLALCLHA